MATFLCLMYYDVFYMLWCILCIVICMNPPSIGPVVSGGTCVGLMYKLWGVGLCYTPHFNAVTPVGLVRCAWRPAQHSRCNACILATLYTYSPVGDSRMRAICTLVSCYIWLSRVWYVCHIYVICFSHCMSCYSFSVNSHTYTYPAINIKLIYSVNIGSTVTYGA